MGARCLTLGGLLVFATAALPASALPPEHPPSGNARGLAILAKVHAAYRRVPAVTTTRTVLGASEKWTLFLKQGISTAEVLVVRSPPTGRMTLVTTGGPTYARRTGSACWKPAPKSSEKLDEVGLRFPDGFKTVVGAPNLVGKAWLLPVSTQGRSPGEDSEVTLVVDAKTWLVLRYLVAPAGGPHAPGGLVVPLKTLTKQPRLPVPEPLCH